MAEKRNSRQGSSTGVALLGLGAVAAYALSRGGGFDWVGGGGGGGIGGGQPSEGSEQGGQQAPQQPTDETTSGETSGSTSPAGPTASQAGADTSIDRMAPSEEDAEYVQEQQQEAAEDPDTTVGQISGAEPETVDIAMTSSAGGGRGPRFDSDSGGEVVLSEPDEDETSSSESNDNERQPDPVLREGGGITGGGL
jgi:hypothetical protein